LRAAASAPEAANTESPAMSSQASAVSIEKSMVQLRKRAASSHPCLGGAGSPTYPGRALYGHGREPFEYPEQAERGPTALPAIGSTPENSSEARFRPCHHSVGIRPGFRCSRRRNWDNPRGKYRRLKERMEWVPALPCPSAMRTICHAHVTSAERFPIHLTKIRGTHNISDPVGRRPLFPESSKGEETKSITLLPPHRRSNPAMQILVPVCPTLDECVRARRIAGVLDRKHFA